MAGNTFGQLFKITTFGESHGGGVGCVVDGCPPGIEISEQEIQAELDRRHPDKVASQHPEKKEDKIHILSGVWDGKTTGTPILLLAYNKDQKPEDYEHLKNVFRPSHADFTYTKKYGLRDFRGSGRASARETLARVAVGAIAKKYLKEKLHIEILSYVESVGNITADIDISTVNPEQIESNIIRCPDQDTAKKMIALVEKLRDEGDSIGGVIKTVIRNVPVGLGEPVFDKLSADLGKAMLSINAVKGFEIGSGFEGTKLQGSQHNDEFYSDNGIIKTKTNNSGGTLGGISTGEDIYFRTAFKPVATIRKPQKTVNTEHEEVSLVASGRHDPCVLPRAVPIVDAMSAIVLMDHYLRHKAQNM